MAREKLGPRLPLSWAWPTALPPTPHSSCLTLTSPNLSPNFLFFFCRGLTQGMQKFPGQGLNLSHSSDNAQSVTREFLLPSSDSSSHFGV